MGHGARGKRGANCNEKAKMRTEDGLVAWLERRKKEWGPGNCLYERTYNA